MAPCHAPRTCHFQSGLLVEAWPQVPASSQIQSGPLVGLWATSCVRGPLRIWSSLSHTRTRHFQSGLLVEAWAPKRPTTSATNQCHQPARSKVALRWHFGAKAAQKAYLGSGSKVALWWHFGPKAAREAHFGSGPHPAIPVPAFSKRPCELGLQVIHRDDAVVGRASCTSRSVSGTSR